MGQRQCRDETPIRAPVGEPRRFAATSARYPGGDRAPHPLCHQPELPDARTRRQVYWRLYNRLVAEADNQHPEAAGKLTAVERRIAGITRAIEDGLYLPAIKARLAELEAEKASLTALHGPAPVVQKVPAHPKLAAIYRRKVLKLESLLTDTDRRDEAM